jgi:hypothetical protein
VKDSKQRLERKGAGSYAQWLSGLKLRYRAAQIKAADSALRSSLPSIADFEAGLSLPARQPPRPARKPRSPAKGRPRK